MYIYGPGPGSLVFLVRTRYNRDRMYRSRLYRLILEGYADSANR